MILNNSYEDYLVTANRPAEMYNICDNLIEFLQDVISKFPVVTREDSIEIRELSDPVLQWPNVIDPIPSDYSPEEEELFIRDLDRLAEFHVSLREVLEKIAPTGCSFKTLFKDSFINYGYFTESFDEKEL